MRFLEGRKSFFHPPHGPFQFLHGWDGKNYAPLFGFMLDGRGEDFEGDREPDGLGQGKDFPPCFGNPFPGHRDPVSFQDLFALMFVYGFIYDGRQGFCWFSPLWNGETAFL